MHKSVFYWTCVYVCSTSCLFQLHLLQCIFFSSLNNRMENCHSASKEFKHFPKLLLLTKVKWWNEMDYFPSFSVFGMFSSLTGIANIDHIFSSMIKKCCLCQRLSLKASQALWIQKYEDMIWRRRKKIADLIFDILLLCVLWFSNVPFLDSSLIIDSVTTIFQNIYTVNTTGSSSHSTGPGWWGLLIAVMGSQTLFQVNITLFTLHKWKRGS